MTIDEMGEFVNNFNERNGLLFFNGFPKPWSEIKNEELKFIDNLLDNRILNCLLAPKGYRPQTREVFPAQLFRAELLKAIKYPEISYRKFCTDEYMGMERKENRRFLGPEHTREALEGLFTPKKANVVKFEPKVVAKSEKSVENKKAV